jgi:hypothetical protein
MPSPKNLSPQEFSEQSGLSIASVRRYLRDGKLPFAQPGGPRGRILIPPDALARLAVQQMDYPSTPSLAANPSIEGQAERPLQRSGPVPAWRRGRVF